MTRLFLRLFSALALVVLLAFPAALPLFAQDQTPAPTDTSAQDAETNTPTQSQDQIDNNQLNTLLLVLQNDQARQKLIAALQAATAETAKDQSDAAAAPAADQAAPASGSTVAAGSTATPATGTDKAATDKTTPDVLPALSQEDIQGAAQKAAQIMTNLANDVLTRGKQLAQDVQHLGSLPSILTQDKRDRIMHEAPLLALTVVATVVIYRALRILARVLVKVPETRAPMRVLRAVALQSLMRAVGLLLAWVAGYGLSLAFGGGQMALVQAYYLNAFLIVGIFTFVLSLVVSYNDHDVTFSQMPQEIDALIFRSVKRAVATFIYTIVLVVPVARLWSNFVIAGSLRSILLTIVLVCALINIRRIRRAVRAWTVEEQIAAARARARENGEEELADNVANATGALWNWVWPPLAGLYVIVCYWIAITRPYTMVDILGAATLKTMGALLVFLLSLRLMNIASHVQIPVKKSGRMMPLFYTKLNGSLPALSVAVALVGAFTAVFWVLSAWDLAHVFRLFNPTRFWGAVSALIIVLVALVIWSLISAWIDDRLNTQMPGKIPSARSRTLLSLARNAFTIAVIVFGGMMALAELGINIAPLIAGAGVVGLAIGFGAQKLVQDIITGVFIQLENAVNEGDVVSMAGISGTVESLTIRSAGVRDLNGVFHLIPFSAVSTVSNFMRRFSAHVQVLGISYGSSIEDAKKAMFEAFEVVKKTPLGIHILGDLEMHGVTDLGDSSVNLRARIRTLPGKQWDVGRAYTEQVKLACDRLGVEIPFPHRELKMPQQLFDSLNALAEARGKEVVTVRPDDEDSYSSLGSGDPRLKPRVLGPKAGPRRHELDGDEDGEGDED